MVKKIYLSPSAQNNNRYAYGNVSEQQICNRIADYAKIALERNGYTVKKAPEGQSFQKNVAESNAWGAEIHMPIHTNAGGGDGTTVLAYPSSVNNKYVKSVYEAVATASPGKDDGIKARSDLYEINSSKCTCVYIECEFHDNQQLAMWIIKNVDTIGEAITKGMCKADGKTYIGNNINTETNTNNADDKKLYRVQVGAFVEKKNAEKLVEKLKKDGYLAYIKV